MKESSFMLPIISFISSIKDLSVCEREREPCLEQELTNEK